MSYNQDFAAYAAAATGVTGVNRDMKKFIFSSTLMLTFFYSAPALSVVLNCEFPADSENYFRQLTVDTSLSPWRTFQNEYFGEIGEFKMTISRTTGAIVIYDNKNKRSRHGMCTKSAPKF